MELVINPIYKKLAIIFLCFQLIDAVAQEGVSNRTYGKLEKGQSKFLLYDKVNLRKDASTESELVVTLPIASNLKIVSKHDSTLTINGYEHYWFEVVVLDENKNETGVKGYLWGGFFAEKVFESKNDPEVKFLCGINKVKDTEWGDQQPYIQIRAVIGQKEMSRLDFEAVGSMTTYRSTKILGNKGLRNVSEILHFNFSDDMCAGAFGDVYVFWDKAILHHAKTLRSGADAPVYSDEIFYFPDDEKGEDGLVIFYEEEGGDVDENGNELPVSKNTTKLYWTGCELKKVD